MAQSTNQVVIHVKDEGEGRAAPSPMPQSRSRSRKEEETPVLYERTDANGDVVTDKLNIRSRYKFEASAFGFKDLTQGLRPTAV